MRLERVRCIIYIIVNLQEKWYVIIPNAHNAFIKLKDLIFGLFIGYISYVIPIFGRMSVYTMPIILFIGVALKCIKKLGTYKEYVTVASVTFSYYMLRFIIYINGYYASDGIMPYINCFDMKI